MNISKDDFIKYNLPQNPEDFENIDVLEPTLGKLLMVPPKQRKREGYGSSREGNSSSYALFFRDIQPKLRSENPQVSFGTLSKLIAAKWDTLNEKYKREYRRQSAKAKRDKLREMAIFKVHQLCSSQNPPANQSQLFYNSIYQQKKVVNNI